MGDTVRGRKTTPSKLVALRGGRELTHRPPRDQEPMPSSKLPPCPDYLDDTAKQEWKRASKVLQPIGLLTGADLGVFAAYCNAYSQWTQAMMDIHKRGTLVRTPTFSRDGRRVGYTMKINPHVKIGRDAFGQMIQTASHLGLSPCARANLKVSSPKPLSKFESFMRKKHDE